MELCFYILSLFLKLLINTSLKQLSIEAIFYLGLKLIQQYSCKESILKCNASLLLRTLRVLLSQNHLKICDKGVGIYSI